MTDPSTPETTDERARLHAERDRLQASLDDLGRDARAVEQSQMGREVKVDGAGGDGDHLSVERGAIRTISAQLESRLAEVDEALAALTAGTFGLCEVCGEAIDPERLEALPGCRECMACKVAGRAR